VVVTGMGVITSLGAGKADNWAKLVDGKSGIRRISRFSNEGLKTKIAGTVDFVPVEPFCSIELGERISNGGRRGDRRGRHWGQRRFPGPSVPRGRSGRDGMAASGGICRGDAWL
jgi:3-oxoacyl-(acyl-carrier-protein) synthase